MQEYAESLLRQHTKQGEGERRYLRLDWAGGLRDYRDRYTAMELRKKASFEWRGD